MGRRPTTAGADDTHTRWDALLAATAEHIAGPHGHAVPEWIDEPERFLAPTWVVPETHCIRYATRPG